LKAETGGAAGGEYSEMEKEYGGERTQECT